jgi:hypothetical protein
VPATILRQRPAAILSNGPLFQGSAHSAWRLIFNHLAPGLGVLETAFVLTVRPSRATFGVLAH